jgi:HrpA-like RNA helicase
MLMEYYNFIIIDEVHERTLALDLILGLVLEVLIVLLDKKL